jgi:hypothetical protein
MLQGYLEYVAQDPSLNPIELIFLSSNVGEIKPGAGLRYVSKNILLP